MEISREEQVSVKRVVEKRKRRSNTNDDDDDDDDSPPKRWSDLPNDLLETIKKRLSYIDQCKLSAVCKSWSCIEQQERNNIIPPTPLQQQQMPWILIFYDDFFSCILVDRKHKKKTYMVDMKSIMKKKKLKNITSSSCRECHESKYGWLLISFKNQNYSNSALFLYSPFLKICIELPILSTEFCMATFTSNPLDDDCIVITLNTSSHVDAMVIKTYRPSRHSSSWDSHQVFKCDQFLPSDIKSWIYTDEGIFYYVIGDGRVGTFDLALEEWKVFPPLPTTMQATLRRLLHTRWTNWVTVYMIKSGEGELFLISECNLRGGDYPDWRYDGQYIYRLDLSSMIWNDLNSIGERVLFIGNGYKAVLNPSVLRLKGDRKELSNAVYCCSTGKFRYCTVHDYTLRDSHKRPVSFSTHYGHSGIIGRGYQTLLIDPPLPR